MTSKVKQALFGTFAAFTVMLAPCCGSVFSPAAYTMTAEAASKIQLSQTSITMEKGKTDTLKLKNAGDKKITWSVKNKKIAAIKASGTSCRITAKSTGTTYIYAKQNGRTYKCKVKVVSPVSLSVTSKSLTKGKSFELKLKNVSSSNITWSVSDKAILKLKKTGKNSCLITGLKTGSAYVSAKYNGRSFRCRVTVKAPSKTVTKKIRLDYLKSKSLTFPEAASETKWSTSDKTVVAISRTKGKACTIKVKKVGTATVTAKTSGQNTYQFVITGRAISNPEFTETSYSVSAGETTALILSGAKGTPKDWKSSNSKIAAVNSKGIVTGKAAGTATISCLIDGLTRNVQITVTKKADPVPVHKSYTELTTDAFCYHSDTLIYCYSAGETDTYCETEIDANGGFQWHWKYYTKDQSLGFYEDSSGNYREFFSMKELDITKLRIPGTQYSCEYSGYVATLSNPLTILDGYFSPNLILEGGGFAWIDLTTDAPESIFTVETDNDNIELDLTRSGIINRGEESVYSVFFCGRKAGNTNLVIKANGEPIVQCSITITSDDADYVKFMTWMDTWIAENWTESMTTLEKLQVLADWLIAQPYSNTSNIFEIGDGKGTVCSGAAVIVGYFSQRLSDVQKRGLVTGWQGSMAGHEAAILYLSNGHYIFVDATPQQSSSEYAVQDCGTVWDSNFLTITWY